MDKYLDKWRLNEESREIVKKERERVFHREKKREMAFRIQLEMEFRIGEGGLVIGC